MIKFSVAQWHNGELLAFIKGLFVKDSLTKLQQQLEQQYQRKVLLLNSARAGIRIALRYAATQQPSRKLVLYPEYICSSVPQAIVEAGFIGKSVAVNEELNMCPHALAALIHEQPLAVILPHMYGVPADIIQIESICRQHQVVLIDDAAQVAGIKVNNQLLGTFGDFGVISFAQAKTVVTGVQGSGGVLLYPSDIQLDVQLKPTPAWRRIGPLWHFWASYQQDDGISNKLDYYLQKMLRFIRNKLKFSSPQYYKDGYEIASPDAAIAIRQFAMVLQKVAVLENQATLAAEILLKLKYLEFPQFRSGRYLTRLIVRSSKLDPIHLAKALADIGIRTKKTYGQSSQRFDGTVCSGLLELPWQGLSIQQTKEMLLKLEIIDTKIPD